MTNEELAKHWGVSPKEAQNISDVMNKNYHLGVVKNEKDNLFYGTVYKMETAPSGFERSVPCIQFSIGTKTAREAVLLLNIAAGCLQLPNGMAEIMGGVPPDAFKALKRLPMPSTQLKRAKEGGR